MSNMEICRKNFVKMNEQGRMFRVVLNDYNMEIDVE